VNGKRTNESEQRFVIKFLFIKGLRSKVIDTELEATLDATMCSLTRAKLWLGQFKSVGLSCQDHLPRPSSDLAGRFRNLLKDFLFASCKVLAGPLMAGGMAVTRVLRDDLGFRHYAR
jgi:hypothetical protein